MAQQADILAKKDYVDENYQPKLVPGTGISINPVTNEITATGAGGSTVNYSGTYADGESIGTLTIDGTGNLIKIPSLVQGTNVTITTDPQTGAKTIAAASGGSTTLSGLTDVAVASATNNQVLKYNSATQTWVNANESGGGVSDLDDLTDVDISSPTNGQVLKYNSTTSKWENGGGGEHPDIPLDMVINQWNQDSNMESNVVDNAVQTIWHGGMNIGANFAFTTPVYLTGSKEPTKITYNVVTTTCWGGGSTAYYPRWNYTVGLCTTPWVGSSDGYNSIPYLIKNEYPNSNTTYEDEEIDLSDIQDNYTTLYLVVSCTGWNAEISDIVLVGGGSGEGGTVVEANPSDTPTDTLETIKIGDTVYDIAGSGGGGGQIDVLYTAESTSAPLSITLSKSLTDYDYIITHIKTPSQSAATIGFIYTVEALTIGDIIGGELATGSGWIWYSYTNATTLTRVGTQNGYFIQEITGLKISAGNGGGGSQYTETELFVNSGTSIADITLSDSLTNYDEVYFDFIRIADGKNYHMPYSYKTSIIPVGSSFQCFGYNEYASFDVASATSLTKVNNSGSWYIAKIIGIKY